MLAQAGIWILTAVVWGAVFDAELTLFSAHPLLNTAGLLLTVQAVLVLQPTHSAAQKRQGTLVHALFHGLGLPALLAGLVVIEYNKFAHDGAHFGTAHNILGLVAYVFLGLQGIVGATQYWTPALYGGESNAKAVWKYHRASGYVTLLLGLAAVCAAVYTDFNRNVLGLKLWSVTVASVLVVLGVAPRIKLQKLGLKK